MVSGWTRAKNALGLRHLNSCVSLQVESGDSPDGERGGFGAREARAEGGGGSEVTTSDASASSRSVLSGMGQSKSSRGFTVFRTSMRFSRSTCAICLESMKTGRGQALFTAECSHAFHFSCITSNVRHGNLRCPVCRAKWKELPWLAPSDAPAASSTNLVQQQRPAGRSLSQLRRSHNLLAHSRSGSVSDLGPDEEEQVRADPVLRILDESIANARGTRHSGPLEPGVFDDDEPLASSPLPREPIAQAETVPLNGLPAAGANSQQESASQAHEGESHLTRQVEVVDSENNDSSVSKANHDAEIAVTCYPEVRAIAASEEQSNFTVLVHLKSTAGNGMQARSQDGCDTSEKNDQQEEGEGGVAGGYDEQLVTAQVLDPSCRAPLDLVTVLDISGSMAGTKLRLLKRAMAFVIRNLSPEDRLSVVTFSSTAKRLFPLRRMVDDGRRHALNCIESLVSSGGTNIADGLKKGVKTLEDRNFKNPMASIMLLSDGQDTYTLGNRGQGSSVSSSSSRSGQMNLMEFRRLLPGSVRHRRLGEAQLPVHTFGFGADHDAAAMHAIAEVSGGTFSFIQAEGTVQDAFARCIGGLLSVVAQTTTLLISTEGLGGVKLTGIQAGSYESTISENGCRGEVKIGDLYDEEERDILLELKVPAVPDVPPPGNEDTSALTQTQQPTVSTVLRVSCSFCDPVASTLYHSPTTEVQVSRPGVIDTQDVSVEVDRQKNRLRIAQTIQEAGHLADTGDIFAAQEILTRAIDELHNSTSFQAGDQLSTGLESELTAIQGRMANYLIYERAGRAYMLSTQSSYFRQRATTRGDFVESSLHDYQTSSMTHMVVRSQTLPVIRRSSASGSTATISSASTRDGRVSLSGRLAITLSPNRMLVRRASASNLDNPLRHMSR